MKNTLILAIESSCDDTSAAIMEGDHIKSNIMSTQLIHSQYGGVVPELASRKHQANILPTVQAALKEAKITLQALDAIAFTQGPGLLGSLLVGCSTAKALALGLDIPLIAVNHMEAHVLAHFIDSPRPTFPFICLTVSGGHSQLLRVDDPHTMEVIGTTIDDAAGEAFDKIGKFLGLPYPAGPEIDKLAQKGTPRFAFTKPKIADYNYSFSGLKTAVMYFLRDQKKKDPTFIENNLHDICASVQQVIVEILFDKLVQLALETQIKEIAIAGGVSANSAVRHKLQSLAQKYHWNAYIPKLEYCTDNAAMIAMAAYFKYQAKEWAPLDTTPNPRMKIS